MLVFSRIILVALINLKDVEQALLRGAALALVDHEAHVTLVVPSFLTEQAAATQYRDAILQVFAVTLAVIVVAALVFSSIQVDELFLTLQVKFSLLNLQGMYERRRVFIQ